MSLFTQPIDPQVLECYGLCDLLDARVQHLHSLMQQAARVLCEDEYVGVAEDHQEAIAPARALRTQFDDLLDSYPASDRSPQATTAYREMLASLRKELERLEAPAESLQRCANAKAETEFCAGRLTADIAHARTMLNVLDADEVVEHREALDAAAADLLRAGSLAADRRWLGALDLVQDAQQRVAAVAAQIRKGQDAAAAASATRVQISESAAALRHVGGDLLAYTDGADKEDVAKTLTSAASVVTAAQRFLDSGELREHDRPATLLEELRSQTETCRDVLARVASQPGTGPTGQ